MNIKNFNIKEYFNFKLYLQGLKRLKLSALVALICLCALSVLVIGADYISIITSYDVDCLPARLIDTINSQYSILHVVTYIVVPVMSLIIWNYLNHRNGSDFYHAIASKRKAVYFSFFAAVLTWAAIIIGAITATTTLIYLCCDGIYILHIGSILVFVLNILISCALVTAAFAIGCSLAGTVFSGLTLSVSIIFVPRFIVTLLCLFLCSDTDLISATRLPELINATCNLATEPILGSITNTFSFAYYPDNSVMTYITLGFPTLYTLILSVIYMFLGSKAYYRRPSEAAGKSTAYGWVQRVITLLMGYFISLIIVFMTYSIITDFDDMFYNIDNIIGYGITFVMVMFFALVTMFIYDLITTKSAKAALKSIIFSPIVLALDVLSVVILIIANVCILSYTPSADDIKYVKVDLRSLYSLEIEYSNDATVTQDYSAVYDKNDYSSSYYDYQLYYDPDYYIKTQLSEKKITDKDIIEDLCHALTRNVNHEKKYNSLYNPGKDSYGNISFLDTCTVYVTFGNGLTETHRSIDIPTNVYDDIVELLLDSNNINKLVTDMSITGNDSFIDCSGLTKKQTDEIYKVYKEELSNIDPATYYNYYTSSYAANELSLYRFINGRPGIVSLPLTEATPKALGLYLKYFNENYSEDFYEIYDIVSKDLYNENKGDNVSLEDVYFNSYDITPVIDGKFGRAYQSRFLKYLYENSYGELPDYVKDETFSKYTHPLKELDKYIKNFQSDKTNADLENFDRDKYILCYISLNVYAEDEPFEVEVTPVRSGTRNIFFSSYESVYYTYDKNVYLYFLVDKNDITQVSLHKIYDDTTPINFYISD